MLDEKDFEHFQEWRTKKLLGQQDLSVEAYNAEMEVQAIAFDRGVKAAAAGRPVTENPYRLPGMMAEPPRRLVSEPQPIIDPEEAEMDELSPSRTEPDFL